MPRYGGKCRHLSAEEAMQNVKQKVESRAFVSQYREERTYTFNDIVKDNVSFESDGIGDFVIVKERWDSNV